MRTLPDASNAPPLDLAALFDAHQQRLLALTLQLTGDFALAEDALQETFLLAHAAAASFRGDAAPATWLHRIAVREALRLRAKRSRRAERTTDFTETNSPSSVEPRAREAGADHQASWREETARLLAALDCLPDDQRLALVLLSAREFSAEAIAVMLDVPPATIYTRAFRARMRLRELLGSAEPIRSRG